MNQLQSPPDVTTQAPVVAGFDIKAALLGVGGLSLLLGLALEALIFVLDPAEASVRDLVSSVVRSLVICTALALAINAWEARAQTVGLAGLLAAPAAFYIARFLVNVTAQILEITGDSGPAPVPPMLLAALKGLEYGCIGLAIGWLEQRSRTGPLRFALVGLVAGAVFGGIILTLTSRGDLSSTNLIPWGVNELLFPTGCTLIIFASKMLGRRS